jgi:hypothetical protein
MGTLINFKLAIIENFPLPEVEDTSGPGGKTCGYKNKADEEALFEKIKIMWKQGTVSTGIKIVYICT